MAKSSSVLVDRETLLEVLRAAESPSSNTYCVVCQQDVQAGDGHDSDCGVWVLLEEIPDSAKTERR